ncbi:MAG TPA: acyltransferase family protein [Terracidiphilus sp.]|nr:acyltransferase family protein [Terracidiphilus sp.]
MAQPTNSLSQHLQVEPPHRDMPYRPDIDGLRAIAILSVVAYHCGLRGAEGGYIGVDIFFVISGFLIGTQVYKEMRVGTFSFAGFYARRARRILPALLVVIAFCCAAGLFLLSPLQLRDLAVSAVAAITSLANLHYYKTAFDYFNPGSDQQPLLITWSLGIEEQFYLLLPPLLLLLRRRSAAVQMATVGAVCAGSAALAIWTSGQHEAFTFYLLPTRAWELGAGVLLAMAIAAPRWRRARSAVWNHGISAAGIALIGCSLARVPALTGRDGFPPLAAVAGAVLLIAAGSGFGNRALAWKPLVFIGRISYSWYLWHGPLLALARVCIPEDDGLSTLQAAGIALISFGIAVLSYYWIEQPFRRSTTPAKPLLMRYAAAASAMMLMAGGLVALHGLPQRSRAAHHLEDMVTPLEQDDCLTWDNVSPPPLTDACVQPGTGPAVALLGDSEAGALAPGLRILAERAGYRMIELGKAKCPPIDGAVPIAGRHNFAFERSCFGFTAKELDFVTHDPSIRVVVLTAYWARPFDEYAHGGYLAQGETSHPRDAEQSWRTVERHLSATIERLEQAGKVVYLMQEAPMYGFDPAIILMNRALPARRMLVDVLGSVTARYAGDFAPQRDTPAVRMSYQVMAHIAATHPQVHLFDPRPALCGPRGCRIFDGGESLYGDGVHFSTLGAQEALVNFDLPPATKFAAAH